MENKKVCYQDHFYIHAVMDILNAFRLKNMWNEAKGGGVKHSGLL